MRRSSGNRHAQRVAVGFSLLAMAAAAPAAAQEEDRPDAQPEDRVGDIVVTAQFREQRLQDTPLAITAVDSAMLEARNQDDIADVARQAPSVTLNEMGGAYGASMGASIRGIGAFDFNPAYEPGVGMYIDDVYYATLTGANFDLLDLERVEILRGPQGTLTGRNSIGGAIKLFSKKPSAETSGYVEAGYGSRNRLEIRGGMNFALAENLYARISGVHKQQEGYVDQLDYGCVYPDNPQGIPAGIGPNAGDADSCLVDKLGETNYSGVRGALRYEGAGFDLMLIGDYQRSDRTSAAEVLIAADTAGTNNIWGYQVPAEYLCGKFCTYANWTAPAGGDSGGWNSGNRNVFEGWGVSAHADIDLTDDVQLQSITAYREYSNQWGTDDDFTPSLMLGAQGRNDLDFWFVSQELRVNARLGDLAELTVGGFYSDQRSVYWTQQDIRYLGLLQFLGNDPINADSKAGFATLILHPMDRLNVTAGIRYTDEHKDYTFSRKLLDGSDGDIAFDIDQLDGVQSVYNGSRWDWRLSVDYRLSPEILAYATIGTGFKGGGVTARPFLPQHAIEGTFDPETVVAYEAGLKTDLFDRRVRLNLAAYYNDYKDIQLPLSDCSAYGGGTCAVVANAGDGKIWGFEAELFAEPVDGLTLDGSLSLTDSKYTDIADAVGSTIDEGSPIVSPTVQASAGIQYELPLGNSGFLTPRFDISHRGKTFMGTTLNAYDPSLEYADAYTLGNARLTWQNPDRDTQIALEVTNVFDTYYNPFRFDAVWLFAGTAYAQVGRPREWRVSVQKDF